MDKKIDGFVEQCKKINGANLVSVVRFGGNRLLIVLNTIVFNDLEKNSPVVRSMERQNVIPLFLTEENIRTSCDVFPLEYSIIKRTGVVLAGDDILPKIVIPPENIRLESEQKIKGCLIRMTQVILEKGGNRKAVRQTVIDSLEDLLSGISGLLALTEPGQTASPEETISRLQSNSGLDLGILTEILEWQKNIRLKQPGELPHRYYETLKTLAVYTDNPGSGIAHTGAAGK